MLDFQRFQSTVNWLFENGNFFPLKERDAGLEVWCDLTSSLHFLTLHSTMKGRIILKDGGLEQSIVEHVKCFLVIGVYLEVGRYGLYSMGIF